MDKRKILARLFDIDLYLSMLSLSVLIVITFLGVFMRYAFNAPFVWLDEMQMTCIVWVTCFGASAAFRHGGHIAIDMIVNLFPAGLKRALEIVVFVVILFMLGFLTWNGWGLVRQQIVNSRLSDVMRIPRAYIYAPMPLAGVCMLLGFGLSPFRRGRKGFGDRDGGGV
ncbi:MAG: TRAP transporter small permease [Planctomycetota bacterium]|jgi:TRAP-type C4-dicarboxylate transport system permease small subunit|nr:TRAP transporter small permease [Planctomycetota bacterium]